MAIFFKSKRFGHLYLIVDPATAYIIIQGVPYISSVTPDYIKREPDLFTPVLPAPIESI